MRRVIILGAGGHAQVVADILLRRRRAGKEHEPIGFLDDNPALVGTAIMDLPVLGTIPQLDEFDHDAIIVAIGDNRTRAGVFETLRTRGKEVVSAIHPAAVIARHVRLGAGVMICAGVVVNTGCTVDHHNRVGNHAHIAPGVCLGGDVTIGEGTLVGVGARVIPQRTIGQWSVIGAGSVVTKDIRSYVKAAGVPARLMRG